METSCWTAGFTITTAVEVSTHFQANAQVTKLSADYA